LQLQSHSKWWQERTGSNQQVEWKRASPKSHLARGHSTEFAGAFGLYIVRRSPGVTVVPVSYKLKHILPVRRAYLIFLCSFQARLILLVDFGGVKQNKLKTRLANPV
jgi:hypothetical protein